MSNLQAYRDKYLINELVKKINHQSRSIAIKLGRPVQVMEICGGHTHAIFYAGLNQLLNSDLEFVHGPGCPVCVLPADAVDKAVWLARQSDVILATFGDVIRVSGNQLSLQDARATGADVRVLYSPYDAIKLAKENPKKRVVFFAVGFDTTMPSIAQTIKAAKKLSVKNLSFLCYHIRLIPTMTALLGQDKVQLDGFIGPGHVSVVIGRRAFVPIADEFGKPLVIAGFEPVDILSALYMLLQQLLDGRCAVENAYARVVGESGNEGAQKLMQEVFRDSTVQWRGVGEISQSVSSLNDAYASFDASYLEAPEPITVREPSPEAGLCQQVLIGRIKPNQCPFFATRCDPGHPIGALMVSSEGACAAYYRYQQNQSKRDARKGGLTCTSQMS